MKSKLAKQKEQTAVLPAAAPPALDIESILREKYAAPAAVPSVQMRAVAAEPLAPEPPAELARRKRDVVRVSVDFPRPLYEAVVLESDEHAQTMRDFMLTLVRQYFERKNRAG